MELKRLSKQLLAANKKTAQETLLQSLLQNEGNCWSELYGYVKWQKGNGEIISEIKHHNGMIIMDCTVKANVLNSYYALVFCCDRNIPKILLANLGETFTINTRAMTKRLPKIMRNKPVGPDGISDETLKLGGKP